MERYTGVPSYRCWLGSDLFIMYADSGQPVLPDTNIASPKPTATRSKRMLAEIDETEATLQALKTLIQSYESVLIAFSGGVDSTLVAKVAAIQLGDRALAVTADSPSMPRGELEDARRIASEVGVRHRVVETMELENPEYLANASNRCYFCKDELMEVLAEVQKEEGLAVILDGTNADDLEGHRPGFRAMKEHGSRSPLAELKITKMNVRKLAARLGLSVAEKPAMACLSSRIEYGQPITVESLTRVGEAEAYIKSLINVRELRVRVHGSVARIEVGRDERQLFFDEKLMDQIHTKLRELGFAYVALDLQGYRSGSLNFVLSE
jgi:pyridinium-3,5-biscarboxylic acid mononucleotide sulfurtransferase